MLFKTIQTPHKLLCIHSNHNKVYIGSNIGILYTLDPMLYIISKLQITESPLSALDSSEDALYIGTWSGTIHILNSNKKISLGNSMIKAIKVFHTHLFVSIDTYIYKLDFDLIVINRVDVNCKVLTFATYENKLLCGTNMPLLLKIDTDLNFEDVDLHHKTSVFGVTIKNNDIMTCSADKSIRCNGYLVYAGKEWIRAITNTAFADGANLYVNNILIHAFKDNIAGIVEEKKHIIAISLDGTLLIAYENIFTTEEEDEEIARLIKKH